MILVCKIFHAIKSSKTEKSAAKIGIIIELSKHFLQGSGFSRLSRYLLLCTYFFSTQRHGGTQRFTEGEEIF